VGLPIFYNCSRCPAYCCSYPRIPIEVSDVERLARHFCRSFPGTTRCGYYDFLSFERRAQEDPEFVPTCWNGPRK